MALAMQLKSMDFVMFVRASEGLTHFCGIAVSFLAMLHAIRHFIQKSHRQSKELP